MFQFFIDGKQYKDPLNWDSLVETIEYDTSMNFYGYKYDGKLIFTGDAYNYLYSKKKLNTFCYIADLKINQKCGSNYEQIFNGQIKIANCKFNLNKCTVECGIEPDGYISSVFNNKSLSLSLWTVKTKNEEDLPPKGLSPTYSWYDLAQLLFNPTNGVYGAISINCCSLYEAFKILVAYMSDNAVGFKSDSLDPRLPITNESEKIKYLTICSGSQLRYWNSNLWEAPIISFNDLFNEVNRLYPIGIIMDKDSSGNEVLRIETLDFFRSSTDGISINNIEDLYEYIDITMLFAKISVGSPDKVYDSLIHSYVPQKGINFGKEDFTVNGQCNLDSEKSLFGNYITDTNIIQELVYTNTGNSDFDNSVFFIECDINVNGEHTQAIKTVNYDDITKYHYNDNLLNVNVLKRNNFGGSLSLPNVVIGGNDPTLSNQSLSLPSAIFMGNQSDCPSSLSSPPPPQTSSTYLITYDIDNAAVFNGTKYTATVAGYYVFGSSTRFDINLYVGACSNSTINRAVNLVVLTRKYNSSNVLLDTHIEQTNYFPASVYSFFVSSQYGVTLNVGDYVTTSAYYSSQVIIPTQASGIRVDVGNTSTFVTSSTPYSVGNIQTGDRNSYLSTIYQFNYPIDKSTMDNFKKNIGYGVLINNNKNILDIKRGWIKRISRSLITGESNIELISNQNNTI